MIPISFQTSRCAASAGHWQVFCRRIGGGRYDGSAVANRVPVTLFDAEAPYLRTPIAGGAFRYRKTRCPIVSRISKFDFRFDDRGYFHAAHAWL